MKVEQLNTGCLAQAAYYIESKGEVAIIDPLRETEPYIKMAEDKGAKIKYVFETHFHADFVSGHIDLAKKTGATIIFGPGAQPDYEAHIAKDNEVFHVGDVKIKVLDTPGHTQESTTYLLIDEQGKDHALFTGDTLFIDEVGRPDLAVKSDLTIEDLAGMLYDSLHNRILPFADDVLVYPAHGAGSSCGTKIGDESYSTLGEQRKNNYALQEMSKEEFIIQVTKDLQKPPQYFPKNVALNKHGYENIDTVINRGMTALSSSAVDLEIEQGALVIDTRDSQTFNKGFIPGSLNIPLNGSYAGWVGTLVDDIERAIVVIADVGKEEEAILRLARVGYENVRGYLQGNVGSWLLKGYEIEIITSISYEELTKRQESKKVNIIDVRKPGEFEAGHLQGAINIPLRNLDDNLYQFDPDESYYLYCQSGYRSMIATSVLHANGYQKTIDIKGGYDDIKRVENKLTIK